MPTIALVANDRNIMTSVSVVLEAEAIASRLTPMKPRTKRLSNRSAGLGHSRYQNPAPRRGGGAAPTPGEVGPAGDLAHLHQRGNRRGLCLGNGVVRNRGSVQVNLLPHCGDVRFRR